MDGANLHLEDSDSKRNKANIGAPNIDLIEQLECVFGRPGHKSLPVGPLLMPQLDSLRNASDTALAMTAAISGKMGVLTRAGQQMSP